MKRSLVALGLLVAACDRRGGEGPSPPSGGPRAPSSLASTSPPTSAAIATSAATVASASTSASTPTAASAAASASASAEASSRAAAASSVIPSSDAGTSSCRLAYGPVQQPFTGEAALRATDSGVEVILNVKGEPVVLPVPTPPPVAKPTRTVASDPPQHASSPACAATPGSIYCVDSAGAVHRIHGGDKKLVGEARPGTRIAATSLGEHDVVAYLAAKKTTEGLTTHAWIAIDDLVPGVLSEEGSGASAVTLARRGEEAVAVYLDARMAMTPVHARLVTWSGAGATLGKDAVLFIAGSPERRTAAVVGVPASGDAFALLPVAGDTDFGMAAIPIHSEPKDDVHAVWSLYPNGLDPALIAATAGAPVVRIARVRPLDPKPDSARVLELGQLDPAGAFTSLGFVPTHSTPTTLTLVADKSGALWLHYTDDTGSWLERRVCP